MTHEELVLIGKKYMSQSIRCNPVLVDPKCPHVEAPIGIIGWKLDISYGGIYTLSSYRIVVQTSKRSFNADKRAQSITPVGLGQHRYYLMPKGIISKADLPKGWGLLEYNPETKKVTKSKAATELDRVGEIERKEGLVLRSALQNQDRREHGTNAEH